MSPLPPGSLRAAVAIVAGATVTIVLAYLGAVGVLLTRFGIPLGAEGRQPTGGEYAGLLLIAAGAAAIGGHIAAGMARSRSGSASATLAGLLAAGTLWGFRGPASQWPEWWAPALAVMFAAGAWLGWRTRSPGG